MEERLFEVESTEHPSGAIVGHCLGCGARLTAGPSDVLAWKQSHKCPETVAKAVYDSGEPVERPGEQETLMDEIAPAREQFDDFERRVLDFERDWARDNPGTGHRNTGPKEAALHRAFPDLSPTRYYQALNRIICMDEAEAYSPVVVGRLRRIRQAAQEQRDRATAAQKQARQEIEDANRRSRDVQTEQEMEEHVSTTIGERCGLLADICHAAGLRAGPGGENRAAPTHVVIGLGPTGAGYYRLVPALGEAVRIYFVPTEGPTRDLGQVLTHARAAGRVLDHLAGVAT